LTRRGKPVARIVPAAAQTTTNILGAGAHDLNINADVLARDDWWKPISEEEAQRWYE
jgi:antitoxin (DNA-binding transcriptional repressor) of toxin-antitoxin stability system